MKSAVAGVGLMFVGGAAIAAPNAEDYVGAWLTTYTCGNFNAVAYLRLSADPAGGSLTGSYAYHPAGRSQPNRVGHFEVTAKVFPSGVIRMTPGKWLKRPRGYGAAPIHGNLSADGSRIVGTIQGAQCDQLVFARSTDSLGPLARQLPGTWRGRFTCADRDFRATLEVDHLAGLPALDIATFSYRPRDPSVPSPAARYEIELSRSAAGVRGTVVKPLMITSNAELYGLDADPSDAGDTLSVRLSDADCSALAMTQPPPPGSLRIVTAQAPMTQLLRKDRVDTLTIADTRTACSLIAEWHRDFRTRFDMGTASLQDIQVRTSYPVYPLMLLAEAFTPYYGRAYDSLRSTPELGDHLANLVPQCRRLAPARDIPSSEFFQVLFGSAWKDRPRVGLRYDRDQLLFDVEQAKAALAWRDDQLARMDARTQLLDPDEIADVRARAETRMVRLSPDLRAPLLMALDSQRAVHVERMETTFAGGADSAETAAAVLTTRQSSLSIAELKALAALLGDTDREIYPDAHRALESRIRRTLKEIRVSKAYNDLSLEARADYLRDTLGRLIDDGDLADQVAEVEVAPELARQRAAQRTRAAAAREQVLATERAQLTSAEFERRQARRATGYLPPAGHCEAPSPFAMKPGESMQAALDRSKRWRQFCDSPANRYLPDYDRFLTGLNNRYVLALAATGELPMTGQGLAGVLLSHYTTAYASEFPECIGDNWVRVRYRLDQITTTVDDRSIRTEQKELGVIVSPPMKPVLASIFRNNLSLVNNHGMFVADYGKYVSAKSLVGQRPGPFEYTTAAFRDDVETFIGRATGCEDPMLGRVETSILSSFR